MDADKYCQILSNGMVESFEKLEMEEGEQYGRDWLMSRMEFHQKHVKTS